MEKKVIKKKHFKRNKMQKSEASEITSGTWTLENLSDGESNPDLPRYVTWQAEIMTVRPSKIIGCSP